ncbi:MAG: hypothetical protein ACLURG_00760 [Gemmiger sp.]
MNYKMVGFVLGRIFLIEAALMLFPMGCAAIYGEWASIPAFLIPVLILLVLGLITSLRTPKHENLRPRRSGHRGAGLGAAVGFRCASLYHHRRDTVLCGRLF